MSIFFMRTRGQVLVASTAQGLPLMGQLGTLIHGTTRLISSFLINRESACRCGY